MGRGVDSLSRMVKGDGMENNLKQLVEDASLAMTAIEGITEALIEMVTDNKQAALIGVIQEKTETTHKALQTVVEQLYDLTEPGQKEEGG
jgi:hypothetical protein